MFTSEPTAHFWPWVNWSYPSWIVQQSSMSETAYIIFRVCSRTCLMLEICSIVITCFLWVGSSAAEKGVGGTARLRGHHNWGGSTAERQRTLRLHDRDIPTWQVHSTGRLVVKQKQILLWSVAKDMTVGPFKKVMQHTEHICKEYHNKQRLELTPPYAQPPYPPEWLTWVKVRFLKRV